MRRRGVVATTLVATMFVGVRLLVACDDSAIVDAPESDASAPRIEATTEGSAPDDGGSVDAGAAVPPMAAGPDMACAIDDQRALRCWGHGRAPAFVVAPGSKFTAVSVGGAQGCAIREDRAIVCWSVVTLDTSVVHAGPFARVSVGRDHACALASSGDLWCWGTNGSGQLGLGNTVSVGVPTLLPGGRKWAHVNAGSQQTCAIDVSGSLFCWGAGTMDGTPEGSIPPLTNASPVSVSPLKWTELSHGTGDMCATSDKGELHCWDLIVLPKLRDSDLSRARTGGSGMCGFRAGGSLVCNLTVPTTLTGDWVEAAVGDRFACARRPNGTVLCWGDGTIGQTGSVKPLHTVPVHVGAPGQWRHVVAAYEATSAVGKNGWMYRWGSAGSTTRLKPTVTSVNIAKDAGSDGGDEWVNAAEPYSEGWCGRLANSSVWCSPGGVSPPTSKGLSADSISTGVWTGAIFALAVDPTQTLYGWGSNAVGQLGIPGPGSVTNPMPIGSDTWRRVAAGVGVSCGIRSDGTLWCWGRGYASPMQLVSTETTWTHVSATGAECAIKEGGLYAISPSGPTRIGSETNWKTAVAGLGGRTNEPFYCGIRTDGSLACLGRNSHGQLGDGTLVSRPNPVQVGAWTDWSIVTAGDRHACALRASGDLYCWGDDGYGQVGDDDEMVLVPTEVSWSP